MSIAPVSSRFERVAEVVAERIADLLGAQTVVTDNHGIVKSSVPGRISLPLDADPNAQQSSYVRVPLYLDGCAGEVIVSEPTTGEAISPRLAQVLVELMVSQTTTAERQPNQHELKNRFIHDLLHGLIDDEVEILREAKVLGMDFVPPRAVILIDAADYILAADEVAHREASDAQIRRRAQFVIGTVVNFFHLPNDTICAYIGDGEVAVLKASNTKNLVSWVPREQLAEQGGSSWANLAALRRASGALLERLRQDTGAAVSMGVGRYHPGVTGLARSYQDARAALSLGLRFHGLNGVHCLDGLGIAAFVGISDERTKVDLATYLLSPLDHEPELLETLTVFFSNNCSTSATANTLSIHRNTLGYRLDKIMSLTGLDPRRFDDAVQIRLALLLRALQNSAA